jgi:hypothetical protein
MLNLIGMRNVIIAEVIGNMNSFKANKSKTIGDRLTRNQGWTTNAYWLIKTELEPKFMYELKEINKWGSNEKPDINKIIKDAEKEKQIEVKETSLLMDIYKSPALLLADKPGTENKIWVNVYYFSLFDKGPYTQFFMTNKALLIKNKGEIIGMIMKINLESEYLK